MSDKSDIKNKEEGVLSADLVEIDRYVAYEKIKAKMIAENLPPDVYMEKLIKAAEHLDV